MATEKIFPGDNPAEAWEIYRESNFEGIPPLDVFNYVVDILITLPESQVEMMAMDPNHFYALSELASVMSSKYPDEFRIRSWDHMSSLANKASKFVAEVNPIHGSLTRIKGIAKTASDNAKKY